MIDKDEIRSLLPHDGVMVLVDKVLRFDSKSICCVSRNHSDLMNPLRIGGQLPVYAGVEYAAQAMALHKRLLLNGVRVSVEADGALPVRQGVVAVASKLEALHERLDECLSELNINVSLVEEMGDSSQYEFDIQSEAKTYLTGRLLVSLI